MSWTHFGDTRPKARKPHACFLCGGPIAAGETYVRRSGVLDDELHSFAMHVECEAESSSWELWEWEEFSEGDMPRPGSDKARAAAERERAEDERDRAVMLEREERRLGAMGLITPAGARKAVTQ